MHHNGTTRRFFIAAAILPLIAPSVFADVLQGSNPARHGRRSREVWLKAMSLAEARVGRADGDLQAVFFVDLNCPACVQLWQWFDRPDHKDWNTLWVPVAHMHATSASKAIALLRATDTHEALSQNFGEAFDRHGRSGGLAPVSDPIPAELSSIRANTHFWRTSLYEATPISLYRKRDGTYWQILGQLPQPQMSRALMELAPASLPMFKEPR